MTILESIEKWDDMPLSRVLFDLVQMGFTSEMHVYPHHCETGVMASVKIEKDGSLAAYLRGSTPAILKARIVNWADDHGLRDFLKEGAKHETEKD